MRDQNDAMRFESILSVSRPELKHHTRMSMESRAAQFSPFAALTGYGAEVKETARLTEERMELDEEQKAALDRKLEYLRLLLTQSGKKDQMVQFTYFVPDERKTGGAYVTSSGIVKKMDVFRKQILLDDGTLIPIEELVQLDGELFRQLGEDYA